jgi:hypothetical protein
MQNIQQETYAAIYAAEVISAIEYFAQQIKNCAHDSIVENGDYAITDSIDSIKFIFENYTQHENAVSLGSAALNSTLDTVVRENIYTALCEK